MHAGAKAATEILNTDRLLITTNHWSRFVQQYHCLIFFLHPRREETVGPYSSLLLKHLHTFEVTGVQWKWKKHHTNQKPFFIFSKRWNIELFHWLSATTSQILNTLFLLPTQLAEVHFNGTQQAHIIHEKQFCYAFHRVTKAHTNQHEMMFYHHFFSGEKLRRYGRMQLHEFSFSLCADPIVDRLLTLLIWSELVRLKHMCVCASTEHSQHSLVNVFANTLNADWWTLLFFRILRGIIAPSIRALRVYRSVMNKTTRNSWWNRKTNNTRCEWRKCRHDPPQNGAWMEKISSFFLIVGRTSTRTLWKTENQCARTG